MECLVWVTSAAIQGERPHSKPPFRTTLLVGLGAQVWADLEAVGAADEEVFGGGADEEAEVDTEVDAREDAVVAAVEGAEFDTEVDARDDVIVITEEGKDADDAAEVDGGTGLGV